jgi:TatD DNase family protein
LEFPLIDSHCHLAGSQFADDLDDVVARAKAGLAGCLVILGATDSEEVARAARVSARWADARFAIGVHPHAAGAFAAAAAGAADGVDSLIDQQPLTRGLGEIGLDYHYDFAPRDVQREVFREQIRLARRRALPIVIHTREAEDDTFAILSEEQAGEVGGVFHCFTGDRRMARRALDLGFHVSLSGIVTFPRSVELQHVAREVPIDRLLIETDSPFLAPVPHRGSRNEPAHVVCVADAVATLRGIDTSTVAEATSANFRRLFRP